MYDTYTLLLKGGDFLMKYALTEDGFAASPPDVITVNAATTATCLMALDKLRYITEDDKDRIIQNLFDLQIRQPKQFAFSWCVMERSSVWSTSRALQGILSTRPELITDDRVQKGIEWLTNQINRDSGFGYMKGCPSRPVYTYHTLRAFLYAYQSESIPDPQKDNLRRLAERAIDYLQKSQVEADTGTRAVAETGIWADKEGGSPCAVSTLFALSTLDEWSDPLGKELISRRMRRGVEFITVRLSIEPRSWPRFDEAVGGFSLTIYLPEVLHLLLKFLEVENKLIGGIVDYITTSYMPYEETLGWTLISGEPPIYSWTTADSIFALVSYSETLRREKILPPRRTLVTAVPKGGEMEAATLMVLTEATKFLFSQLGKGIELWRQKKGEQAKPQIIESSERHGIPIVKLDEMELTVDMELLRMRQSDIQSSLTILKRLRTELNTNRERLTDTLLDPKTEAYLRSRIPELERQIDDEGKKLEGLLEKIYGGRSG